MRGGRRQNVPTIYNNCYLREFCANTFFLVITKTLVDGIKYRSTRVIFRVTINAPRGLVNIPTELCALSTTTLPAHENGKLLYARKNSPRPARDGSSFPPRKSTIDGAKHNFDVRALRAFYATKVRRTLPFCLARP